MGKSQLHHTALSVQDYDWYQKFFEEVFEMSVRKKQGEAPKRQLWFHEGIQLNETSDETTAGVAVDHISLAVSDIPSVISAALSKGCTRCPKGDHWFILPNDVKIELMQL